MMAGSTEAQGKNPLVRSESRDTLAEINDQLKYLIGCEDRNHAGYVHGLMMIMDAVPIAARQSAAENSKKILSQNVSKQS